MKKFVLITGAIAAFAFLAYRTFERPKGAEETELEPLNLILISIDTVRTDYLQIYNPKGAPTPNLTKLASTGYLFTNVIAQAPFTLPSHCTMLTGTYPVKHKVQDNIATKLGNDALTLAEILKSQGYDTAGFIGSLVLESSTGIDQGFDTFDDSFVREDQILEDRSGVQKDAASVKRSFLHWLDQRQTTSSFFAFIHLYDAHAPYDPPAPFRPDVRDPRALYRGELQYVDSVIGEIVDDLSRRQLLNRSILAITGDHGEMLGEHGENGHGFFIYQEAVRVPLIFSVPNQAAGKSDEVLELVDLAPTLLELLEIPIPESVQGQSFVQSMQSSKAPTGVAYSESLTAAQHFGAAPLRSLQDARYKYIDSPQAELYDLRFDTQERQNIAGTQQEIVVKMKTALEQILTKHTDTSSKNHERELSPEQQEQLAALGYIGGNSETDFSDSKLDAKEVLPSWNDLGLLSELVKQPNCTQCLAVVERIQGRGIMPVQARIFAARAHGGLGDYKSAISVLQGIVRENPRNVQARLALAQSQKKAGDVSSALHIYKKLMEEDYILGLENYAELMIQLNRKEELGQVLQQFTTTKKLTEKHYPVLGEIYLLLGRREEAQKYLNLAMEEAPENPYVYIHLSALRDAEGRTSDAIRILEQHRGRFHTADYLMQLGRLYAKSGSIQKEHEVFQEMVRSFPKDPRGYFFLAKIVLQNRGDAQQVIRLAEKGLSLNPDAEMQSFGFFLLGDAHNALGQTEKAQAYLKKAEELRSGASNLQ